MPNTLYQKGVYFERLTKNWLEREGYLVMRSAGSKSPNDLAVFPMVGCNEIGLSIIHPFVIQCKAIDTSTQILALGGSELVKFATQKFNNNYIDKYIFIYDIKVRKKIPIIYKWVINRWILIQHSDDKNTFEENNL